MARSLVKLNALRKIIVKARWLYNVKVLGMDLHETCSFSLSARFDRYYPAGVHVGADSYIAAEAIILTHDITRGVVADTVIGRNCFIGMRAIIMPGVTIHDGSVIGAGSVVTRDIPPASLAAGNPAKVLRQNEEVGRFGQSLRVQEQELRRRSEVGIN